MAYDKSVTAAIQQIQDRHYTQAFEGYVGEILLVGVDYDKDESSREDFPYSPHRAPISSADIFHLGARVHDNKPHSCMIKKIEKLS